MKIIEPTVEILTQHNTIDHIATCARICYASNTTNNNSKLCKTLWNNKHRSMFRHASVYYIIPKKLHVSEKAYVGSTVKLVDYSYYVSTNEQCAREYWDELYYEYRIPINEAIANDIFNKYKMIRITICIETGIDITREYNRKSPNNIAEQSTRYIDFNKKIGIRFKKCHWMHNSNIWKEFLIKLMCKTSELFYKISSSKYGLNLKPQDARWILPLDTMSKVVYTYTIKEWEEIINMRYYDYTGKAHPDAKKVAALIHLKLNKLGYIIRDYNDIKYKECIKNTIYPE